MTMESATLNTEESSAGRTAGTATDSGLLRIENLSTSFFTKRGVARAVDGVSFTLSRGEVLGVVGESGSGKSVMGRSVMGLIKPPGRVVGGSILFTTKDGEQIDLANISVQELMKIRGRYISMIFQEPMSSLNPVLTIGDQMTEGILFHGLTDRQGAVSRAKEMLDFVRIKDPASVMQLYQHQLSGGMRQRVMIAMALMCEPDLLIADEPTTALDVTIQAQILELLMDIRDRTGMAIIFITHNMGVIAEISDSILVMYCGKVMEYGLTDEIQRCPRHPYTTALIESIPKLDEERKYLSTIPGLVPNLTDLPDGCRFASRCSKAIEICHREEPSWLSYPNAKVNCHRDFSSSSQLADEKS